MPEGQPFAGAAGAAGVSGILAALASLAGTIPLLLNVPAAYTPGLLDKWVLQAVAAPAATAASAWLFTLGMVLLVPFAVGLARAPALAGDGRALAGCTLIAVGGLMNGAATLAPFVVIQHLLDPAYPGLQVARPAALALLGLAVTMDALFNALFGLGTLLVGWALVARRAWPWLGRLGIVAGLLTIPVAVQAVSPIGAALLVLAGPLWLAWVTLVSLALWRAERKEAAGGGPGGQ